MSLVVNVRERRAEALPGDNEEGVESLFLGPLSRRVYRCQCEGRGAEACQGTDVGGA